MSWRIPPVSDWNLRLYRLLHATDSSSTVLIAAARYLAELPLIIASGLMIWHMMRRRDGVTASRLLIAAVSVFAVEAITAAIQYHPRPFEVGFGPAWAVHPANNSMPSTHVALTWMMAATFLLEKRWGLGILLTLLGASMAWARICLGIHWPADMLGAAISGALSAVLARNAQRGWAWLARRSASATREDPSEAEK
jgi:undecaprenyl-diphosphatase